MRFKNHQIESLARGLTGLLGETAGAPNPATGRLPAPGEPGFRAFRYDGRVSYDLVRRRKKAVEALEALQEACRVTFQGYAKEHAEIKAGTEEFTLYKKALEELLGAEVEVDINPVYWEDLRIGTGDGLNAVALWVLDCLSELGVLLAPKGSEKGGQ